VARFMDDRVSVAVGSGTAPRLAVYKGGFGKEGGAVPVCRRAPPASAYGSGESDVSHAVEDG
jgi:hypothetical protein